ncbi:MAG: hypothetical protein K2I96_00235 [Lachnospiraceae bacterium]|nr:hypothetical protein [Lachnospiraceae bacterium]
MGRRRRRQLKTAWILAAVFVLAAGSLCFFVIRRSNHIESEMEKQVLPDDNIVTAAGVTETGMDAVIFAIDFLENTSLCVEDVYLANGDTAAAGQAYLKFTDDSIERARAALEKAVQTAELACRIRAISIGEDKIQAKYTYDTAVLEAEFAPQVYQDTLTRLEMQLMKAQKAYEEAQEEYNAYYLAVTDNTFYEDYQIGKLKKAYEDAYDLCTNRGKYWEVTEEELEMWTAGGARAEQSDRQWIIETVALLRKEALEAKAEYEQAQQDYQREIGGAELKLQKLFNQLEQAEQNLIDAQLDHQKGSLHAKTAYELAVAGGQIAESDYNVRMMRLDNELEHLEDARDRAAENKALFEELIGDGYFYTEQAGTVLMTPVEKGQELAGGEQILAYCNPEKLFVSAMVPEMSAEKLFVGEKAGVMIEDYGSFDGIVETICPVAISDKRASVCNMVVVSLLGDVSALDSNLTASVVFGEHVRDETIECNAGGLGTEQRALAAPMYDLDIYDLNIYDFNAQAGAENASADCLKVAEIYVEAGQAVREGDLVCRFTQNSVEQVRKALVYAQSDAQMALMKAQAGYHIGVLEAGLSHNEAVFGGTLAQTAYDNTIAKLNSGMVAKILETEQLLADIYQLQTALADDSYQRQRADLSSAYDQAKKQMENAKECFVTSQIDAVQALQTAKGAYEDFFSQLEDSNQQIADKVEQINAIQNEILQSQQLMERELLTADQARSSAEIEGEIANVKYESIVKEYENAVRKAQSDLEQATQKLEDFDWFVGDGAVYAAGSGLVTAVGYGKGDLLDDARKLVSFVADTDHLREETGKEDIQ